MAHGACAVSSGSGRPFDGFLPLHALELRLRFNRKTMLRRACIVSCPTDTNATFWHLRRFGMGLSVVHLDAYLSMFCAPFPILPCMPCNPSPHLVHCGGFRKHPDNRLNVLKILKKVQGVLITTGDMRHRGAASWHWKHPLQLINTEALAPERGGKTCARPQAACRSAP